MSTEDSDWVQTESRWGSGDVWAGALLILLTIARICPPGIHPGGMGGGSGFGTDDPACAVNFAEDQIREMVDTKQQETLVLMILQPFQKCNLKRGGVRPKDIQIWAGG